MKLTLLMRLTCLNMPKMVSNISPDILMPLPLFKGVENCLTPPWAWWIILPYCVRNCASKKTRKLNGGHWWKAWFPSAVGWVMCSIRLNAWLAQPAPKSVREVVWISIQGYLRTLRRVWILWWMMSIERVRIVLAEDSANPMTVDEVTPQFWNWGWTQ